VTKYITLISLTLVLICCGDFVKAGESPSFLLLHEDAKYRLDSLNRIESDSNLVERIILMHNLGFNGDKKLREKAEKLVKDKFKKGKRAPLVEAYDGSLRMIKVKHKNTASKIFGSFFGNSPYKEARNGFNIISEALERDPNNINIRFVRASAAVESAEHLPELLVHADIDILWLESNIDRTDAASVFFFYLTKAKFYYKSALEEKKILIKVVIIEKAIELIDQAGEFVCSEVFCREHLLWQKKIEILYQTGSK
jgi:hypothetical protein